MTDPHPTSFEIEIDRESLCKYLRYTWLRGWTFAISFFGLLFGLIFSLERIADGKFEGLHHLIFLLTTGPIYGILIGMAVAIVLYFMLCHFRAKRISETLSLKVDGAFLQITQHLIGSKIDRKIHFRAVTDFSVIEDNRMRKYNIKALQMNTTGGSPTGLIRIDGVKDCDNVRDMLAEIDSLRENQTV
ncbi:MAG: hypothetical protein PF795_01455 [Kiritimatiellae bacterium]|jgi:hypothetical protein|nr:hypothetical protein [Kiritimatiellia bacterium]